MRRISILYILVLSALSIVVIRLFYIQLLQSDRPGGNQYLKTQRIKPMRGIIYDRHGDPLVLNKTYYKLIFEPKNIKNKEKTISKIDTLLNIGEATLEAKIYNDKVWVPVKDGIDISMRKKIEKLNIIGLSFEDSDRRFYPESSIAAHLIGFAGKDDLADTIGYFGIEGYYNKDLSGLPGLVKTERDVFGKPIFIGIQNIVKGEDGRSITLTIDKTVQSIVKKHLKTAIEKFQAESGCVILLEPYSGEIIALSCLPDYDPNKYNEFSDELYTNQAVSTPFEPGSIFKPLIMAAALNEKTVKMSDTITETGRINIGSYSIANWDDKYKGTLTMTQIIEYSSNIGMVKVASTLKEKKIQKYLKLYGFGDRTGVDLQGEAYGLVKETKNWYPIDSATISFGQGIAVTPIQMISAFAALVNGGTLVKPHVVLKMQSSSSTKWVKPEHIRKVITTKTSREIVSMLKQAVEHGEVKWKIPSGYTFGGKTGTAQIPIEGHYDPTKTIASFVGFVPLKKPKFIALVTLRKPAVSQWGSETAAPLFFSIASELVVYYNIPKDKP